MIDGAVAAVTDRIAELTIAADPAEVRVAAKWLAAVAAAASVPAEQIDRLDHCLDEVLANVFAHGGAGARAAPITLRFVLRRDAGGAEAVVTIVDSGIPFDPLGFHGRPRPQSLADAEPGGLGLVMLHSFADLLGYQFRDGRNHLTFAVRWTPGD